MSQCVQSVESSSMMKDFMSSSSVIDALLVCDLEKLQVAERLTLSVTWKSFR